MSTYDLPDVIEVREEGPIRIVTLNRPEALNATNEELHEAIANLFPQLDADEEARAAVITGAGRAFSAGGDFSYLDELTKDDELRRATIVAGKKIVTGMIRCRIPIVAAVNGPAVGLGCSIVALSDIVYIAESAYLSDPHVDDRPGGRRRRSHRLADAHQHAPGQGVRAAPGIASRPQRAAEIGLANHVSADDKVLEEALACATRIARLPRRAIEDTKGM